LLFSEAVLAEFSHEPLYLLELTAVQIREAPENFSDLLLGDAVVEPERKLNLLDLMFEVLPTDKFGTLKQYAHRFLL